ncbi:DUF159 domain protein [Acrodontium crateriforme]|uniref:DUF159 domain protein n=1 Tax=Acrodontium crateriforme TaxID=150365 RepID=A0AAQ3RAC5_9PEZI|nr:DUF159 domain protein [Acrodontium crateriforme]
MCGRYALHLRPSEVRERLEEQNMPSDSAPSDEDDQLRQSYNFAPGYHGLIYRADTSDYGNSKNTTDGGVSTKFESPKKKMKFSQPKVDGLATEEIKYKLQAAKWGLVPFWTKRPPDYASQMRTINCRDDSLMQNGGLWGTVKQRKRCVVVVEGFYEWLEKGKDKLPHYMKRKDGQIMCLAGLWDVVTYENMEKGDKLYSYTIITTDSNKQLKFLHNRMPVILEPGSAEMQMWLDPTNIGWTEELQGILKPYTGELECYQVDKAVGKVGNNKPNFVVPLDSKENKNNIMNFFGSRTSAKTDSSPTKDIGESRETSFNVDYSESGAPLPKPKSKEVQDFERAIQESKATGTNVHAAADRTPERVIKLEIAEIDSAEVSEASNTLLGKRKRDSEIKKECDGINHDTLLRASTPPLRTFIKREATSPELPAASKMTTPRKSPSKKCHSQRKGLQRAKICQRKRGAPH